MEQYSIGSCLEYLAGQVGRQVYAVVDGDIVECQITEFNIYSDAPDVGVSGLPGHSLISYAEGERVFEDEKTAKQALIESLKAKIADLENE